MCLREEGGGRNQRPGSVTNTFGQEGLLFLRLLEKGIHWTSQADFVLAENESCGTVGNV